ncbi:MAG TPA: sensor histidine kinase [Clostridia bacterium]|nr:sensor histidine kinase [Clostridia bacterium]
MTEISLHILDILQNAKEAGATKILLAVLEDEQKDILAFTVADNGRGMDDRLLERAFDPFTTTRQSRKVKVGLGLPMLKATAEASGGYVKLYSRPGKGTRLKAVFQYSHLDRPPIGNLAGSICVFLADTRDLHLRYVHRKNGKRIVFDSRAFAAQHGVTSFAEPQVFRLLLTGLQAQLNQL